ncbi:NirA family protein [Methylocella silvestris]|uniref:Ferredoxin--nitrite reductase n=1 Tax=Methylocella silvestris TaxID=199596 RepID=A0A2J7TC00_METSI|nr:NirA family protein [Methylocella silvestris]PNG24293.1 ferredoxin--nitrite reductase [Methylocella silvestris]
MSGDFSAEQKRYLEGFASGLQIARAGRGLAGAGPGTAAPSGPDAPHLAAMARQEAQGKKLVDQEKWKREEHPFDAYHRLKEQARRDEFPKPPDNFRWRYYGLFYVAPNQDAYMCRLRIPNGVVTHWQFAALAEIADRFAGGYSHVTTRANLQLREIPARHATGVLEAIQDIGLSSRHSGADNIRNVTGDATAGFGVLELLDTRPYAREWHFHVQNERVMSGLPRKFNVAFDGGGAIATLEDTNDIGFQAVEVLPGASVPAGVYFRLLLGGISGHRDLARPTGVVVAPAEATKIANAIVLVFIDRGNRADRNKARLKYVLDDLGFDAFLKLVEEKLGHPLARIDENFIAPRPAQDRQAHIGVHPQRQPGLYYIGLVLPVGKLTSDQMRAVAAIARDCGDGEIRLTVWQNLLLPGIPEEKLQEAKSGIEAAGLEWRASSIRAGLIACTGSKGCRLAAADTKGAAQAIAAYCEPRVELDQPVNIHVTGCHNSCAQHYIGDIGLIGARVADDPDNEDSETVDGFNVFVGGGYGVDGAIGRELATNVKASDAPQLVESLLKAYMAGRASPEQSFQQFTASRSLEDLQSIARACA